MNRSGRPLVIWDFDGPIFGSRRARDDAFESVLTRFSEQVGACSFDYSATPLYDPRKLVRLAFADSNLPEKVLEDFELEFRKKLNEAEAACRIDRDVISTIENLSKQCGLAILSLRSEQSLTNLLHRHRLFEYFNCGVLGRDSSPASKPSPDAIYTIMEKANASAADTVFVGDSDHDWKAARAAGIAYFHAGWSDEPVAFARAKADLILARPAEVEMVLIGNVAALSRGDQFENKSELKKIARSDNFSFFAGAGVSIDAGFGSWESCYLPLLNEHFPRNALTGFSFPELVQMIVAEEDRAQRLFDGFKSKFAAQPEPSAYHYAMLRSACDTIWTTNYDNLFESASLSLGQNLPSVRDDSELKDNFVGRKLIKLNGDFQAARFDRKSLDWGIVLSDEQFDLSEVERPEMWRYFEDEYRTSSLIFVGVSFGDPSLRRIISIISRKLMRTRKPHFVLAAMPRTPNERLIVTRQIEVLRRRNIRTLLFDDFKTIAEFVSDLCILSRKPVIAFSGIAFYSLKEGGRPSAQEMAEGRLNGGVLSLQDIDQVCGDMGASLARYGFRVVSGHGEGVGVPAVARAYDEDRRSARYYMRKKGETQASRRATTIFVADDDLDAVRQKLARVAHVFVAMGGASNQGWESGTVKEVRKAIELGRPVILFRQGGGDVDQCFPELMTLMQRRMGDPKLRGQVETLNETISKLDREQLMTFLERDFVPSVRSLVATSIVCRDSSYFVTACLEADSDW
jgi:HAD superfamily hydrolase (TIGR01549 family)